MTNTAQKAGTPAKALDAIELLTEAHQEIREAFKEYGRLITSGAESDEKYAVAADICSIVTAHAMVKEELFYPAARQVVRDDWLLKIAEVEHEEARSLINTVMSIESTDPLFDARMHVLRGYVVRHAEREERELFPKVREADIDLGSLGAQIEARQAELLEGGVF